MIYDVPGTGLTIQSASTSYGISSYSGQNAIVFNIGTVGSYTSGNITITAKVNSVLS
jgi:hypothetical protein